ncbi:MAG: hypothetical protein FJW95_02780 [Actinobacteria bacterium]|nr:hypothetical protein [Actinomycetota bacterium]
MAHAGDEAYLEESARRALPGEAVEAAGIFSWQGLLVAGTVGVAAGATAGDLLAGGGGEAVGAALGYRAAVEAAAASQGMTVRLLVVVTPDSVRVLRWEGDDAGAEVRRFDRATTDVHVSKMGLSRILTLHDTVTNESFALHGSVAPFSVQSKPDKVVLHLLTTG